MRYVLEEEHFEVVAECDTGSKALEILPHLAAKVVIYGINMQREDATSITRKLLKQHPQVKLIGYTARNEDAFGEALLEAGATAFMPHNTSVEQILETIKKAAHE